MELHESLYSMRWAIGQEHFEDPDEFRAAVDDFLDEGKISDGQVNLLVDALKFGALQRTVELIDSGAEPTAAVEAAGEFLSRERGTADLTGSQWACAVLGYAVGKVQAVDVARFQSGPSSPRFPSGSASSAGSWGTADPPPAAPTTTAPPGTFEPAAQTFVPGSRQQPVPGQFSRDPAGAPGAVGPHGGSWPPPGPWSGSDPDGRWHEGGGGFPPPQPPRTRRRRRAVLLATAVGVVVVVAISGIAYVLLRDTEEPKPPPPSYPMAISAADVNETYAVLGGGIAAQAEECALQEPTSSEPQKVICEMPMGTLTLTTHEALDDLRSGRDRVVSFLEGTRYSSSRNGTFYSRKEQGSPAVLYWDDRQARQSATYETDVAVRLPQVHRWFRSLNPEPSVGFPTGVEHPALIAFIDSLGKEDCERQGTNADGATETDNCSSDVSFGTVTHFRTVVDMKRWRRSWTEIARTDWPPAQQVTWDRGGPVVGAYVIWYDAEGASEPQADDRPWLYFDDVRCRCSVVAQSYDDTDDFEDLYTDWGFSS